MNLQRTIGNLCLKCKLRLVIFSICGLFFGLTLSALFVFEVLHFRSGYKRDTAAVAAIVADNSTAALAFVDRKAAGEILASLKAIPHVQGASLTEPNGSLVAQFGELETAAQLKEYPAPGIFKYQGGSMLYTRQVMLEGQNLGCLFLRTDYHGMLFKLVRFYSLTILAVLALSIAPVLLLSQKLSKIISNPILNLADSARQVGEKHDYSVRSQLHARKDELGVLARAFNGMLERIQTQDSALSLSRQKLDSLVHSIDGIVWEWDPKSGAFTFVSRQSKGILGYPPDQWFLKPGFWDGLIHPEDIAIAREEHRQAIERCEAYQCEYRMLDAGQNIIWIRDSGVVLAEAGQPVSLRGIFQDITRQKTAADELASLNRELVEASRHAGMAEVATGVLHNVGNVLNSVNVSASVIRENLRTSAVASAVRLKQLLEAHQSDFVSFFSNDPKGRAVPGFVIQLAGLLHDEHVNLLHEHELLAKNVEHIKEIVAMQQNYARLSGFMEAVSMPSLVDDALQINSAALSNRGVEIVKHYTTVPDVTIDKHKVLQILVNLIQNAKHALDSTNQAEKRLEISVNMNGDQRLKVIVKDNGVGIPPENLTRVFSHGFTTRKGGHGFGLHSGANAAREMGGLLQAHSDGAGKGATFTLELPLTSNAPK